MSPKGEDLSPTSGALEPNFDSRLRRIEATTFPLFTGQTGNKKALKKTGGEEFERESEGEERVA